MEPILSFPKYTSLSFRDSTVLSDIPSQQVLQVSTLNIMKTEFIPFSLSKPTSLSGQASCCPCLLCSCAQRQRSSKGHTSGPHSSTRLTCGCDHLTESGQQECEWTARMCLFQARTFKKLESFPLCFSTFLSWKHSILWPQGRIKPENERSVGPWLTMRRKTAVHKHVHKQEMSEYCAKPLVHSGLLITAF